MNWGGKIIIVYGIFVAGILFLVVKSSMQKMDLVTTDYYAKELKYQDKIDEQKRVNELSDTIKYEVKNNLFSIVFPKDFSGKNIEGEAVLYSPSDENNDVKHSFSVDNNTVNISLAGVKNGLYNLQLTWKVEAVNYYYETKIDIKK
jgi:hypothetical protein